MQVKTLAQHVLRRSYLSLWENIYLNIVSATVIGAALLLVGTFLTINHNLMNIVETWEQDVHVSAYFHEEVTEQRRFARRDEVARDQRVEQVRYVSEADARVWLEERIEGIEDVLDDLGSGTLPASLEIKLTDSVTQPSEIASFVKDMHGPEFRDVDFGLEWVQRFNAFLSLLKLMGAVLGLLILMAALFLVTNTVHLIVYNRKNELEVQKLVGATAAFITAPFIVEGFVQGLLGGISALLGMWAIHRLLVERLQSALKLEVAGDLQHLPMTYLQGLLVAGILVGMVSGVIAVRRFLVKIP